MSVLDLVIVSSLAAIFVGFPSLLVVMAGVTLIDRPPRRKRIGLSSAAPAARPA